MDSRIEEHAKILVKWSTEVKKGDMVSILASPDGYDLVLAVVRQVSKAGGRPVVMFWTNEISRAFFDGANEETVQLFPEHLLSMYQNTDVIIAISAPENTKALSGISSRKQVLNSKTMEPILAAYLSKRWVSTVHPCNSLAQQGNMSLNEYRDFVYEAILIDWKKESKFMHRIMQDLAKESSIRFVGSETDLYASTENKTWVAACGKENMPDGEIYTAPVETSVEGKIYFDIPFMEYGKVIQDVRLIFDKGEIVDYSAEKEESTLKQIIETDEGARRLGEIAIGTNRGIKKYTLNMLFDEKIGDTIHCALGRAYEECNGTNKSAVHVDIVKSMHKGEIYAGDKLIYSQGKFHHEK